MDDYILIHHDKKYLEFVRDKIINILNDIYHLKVNKNKTMIKSNTCGISFLGYNFKVINKKTIIRISNSSKKKLNNYDSQNNLRGKIKSRITSNDNFKINI